MREALGEAGLDMARQDRATLPEAECAILAAQREREDAE